MAISLLLVDDHELFRESLAQALSAKPDFAAVRHCSTAAEAEQALASDRIDVVLLDYDLRSDRGSTVVSWAVDHAFGGRFLVLTAALTEADALWLIQHGVAGILLKERPLSELAEAIRTVAQGGIWLDQPFLKLVISAAASGAQAANGPAFTPLERRTLRLLVEGYTNKEIACRIESSEAAVKATIQRLFDKVGVRSRGNLIRIAVEEFRNEL